MMFFKQRALFRQALLGIVAVALAECGASVAAARSRASSEPLPQLVRFVHVTRAKLAPGKLTVSGAGSAAADGGKIDFSPKSALSSYPLLEMTIQSGDADMLKSCQQALLAVQEGGHSVDIRGVGIFTLQSRVDPPLDTGIFTLTRLDACGSAMAVAASTPTASPAPEAASSALRCELRGNDGGPVYLAEHGPDHFHFVLISLVDGTKVYQQWNSWGYATRSFKAVDTNSAPADSSGAVYAITRRPGSWAKNAPTTHVLNKGDFLITDIAFCDGTWSVTPKLPAGQYAKLQLTGEFRIQADADARASGVWTGAIESAPVEGFLEKECVARLNGESH